MITVHVNAADPEAAPVALLERAIRTTLAAEGVDEGEVSLTLLDDEEIRELNRQYLDRDRPTDVLAFALHEPGEPLLADVYVGVERARRQAREAGARLAEELARLAIHGTLHVLGWDHPEGEGREASEMFERQDRLVRELLSPKDAP